MTRVAVLLASHNGSKWIGDQIETILGQVEIDIKIFVSDDMSCDDTLSILEQQFASDSRVSVMKRIAGGFGSPAANFFRLLIDAPIDRFDYVFLSDQDDLWMPEKVISAVTAMQLEGADCYASDLVCVYADGKKKPLKKCYPQTRNDYLFQGASAGCTYGLSMRAVALCRESVEKISSSRRADISHDWAIYAFTRSRGLSWVLDSRAFIDYRQHDSNAYGALGPRSYYKRWRLLRDGWYRQNILTLASACSLTSEQQRIISAISHWGLRDRVFLLSKAWSLRRRPIEKIYVAVFILLGLL